MDITVFVTGPVMINLVTANYASYIYPNTECNTINDKNCSTEVWQICK